MEKETTLFYTPDEDKRLDFFENIVFNMVNVYGNLLTPFTDYLSLIDSKIKRNKELNGYGFKIQDKFTFIQNFLEKIRNLNIPVVNYQRNINVNKFTEKIVKKIQSDGQCNIKVITARNLFYQKIYINTFYYGKCLECILDFTKSLLVLNKKINLTLGYEPKFDNKECFYFQIKTTGYQSGLSVINPKKLFQPMFYNNTGYDDVKFITMYFFMLVRKMKGTICYYCNNSTGEAYFNVSVPVKFHF